MIIFPSKTDRTIKDLTVPDNLCIVNLEKVWMDERLMMVWYEKTWLRYMPEKNKRNRFSQVLNGNVCV